MQVASSGKYLKIKKKRKRKRFCFRVAALMCKML